MDYGSSLEDLAYRAYIDYIGFNTSTNNITQVKAWGSPSIGVRPLLVRKAVDVSGFPRYTCIPYNWQIQTLNMFRTFSLIRIRVCSENPDQDEENDCFTVTNDKEIVGSVAFVIRRFALNIGFRQMINYLRSPVIRCTNSTQSSCTILS